MTTRNRLDDSGFEPRWWEQIFLPPHRPDRPWDPPSSPSLRWVPGLFPASKVTGLGVDHSQPSGDQAKNGWSYTSAPPMCDHGMQLGSL